MIPKIGIIGCGRVAEHYLKLAKEGLTPFLEYTAWFDTNPKKSYSFQTKFGGKSFETLDKFLSSDEFEAVLILTPSGSHYRTALEVMKFKKHLVVEKPICLKFDELKNLKKKALESQVVLMTVLQNRFNDSVLKFKELQKLGTIGNVLSGGLRLRWGRDTNYYSDGWHGTWAMDGGVVAQQAIHHIFAIDNLIGPIIRVSAKGLNRTHKIEAEDTCIGLFELQNGAIITFELTTSSKNGDFEASISLLTSNGIYEINGRALNNLVFQQNLDTPMVQIVKRDVDSGYGYGHISELQNFVGKLNENPNGWVDINDGARALQLVHSIYASIERGMWIEVNDENSISLRLGVGLEQ